MKSQLNDIKASLLFLLIFQLQEGSVEGFTEIEIPRKIANTKRKLQALGYIKDQDQEIIYDEDGYPTNIEWQNENQNSESILKIYEATDYNPFYMAQY